MIVGNIILSDWECNGCYELESNIWSRYEMLPMLHMPGRYYYGSQLVCLYGSITKLNDIRFYGNLYFCNEIYNFPHNKIIDISLKEAKKLVDLFLVRIDKSKVFL